MDSLAFFLRLDQWLLKGALGRHSPSVMTSVWGFVIHIYWVKASDPTVHRRASDNKNFPAPNAN